MQVDVVPRAYVRGDLPVDLDGKPAGVRQHLQAQAVVNREDQPAVISRMWCRGRDEQRLDSRADYRAAGGEAVGSGARRRGDQQRSRALRRS